MQEELCLSIQKEVFSLSIQEAAREPWWVRGGPDNNRSTIPGIVSEAKNQTCGITRRNPH